MNHEQVVMQETLSPAQPLTEEACAGNEQNAAGNGLRWKGAWEAAALALGHIWEGRAPGVCH